VLSVRFPGEYVPSMRPAPRIPVRSRLPLGLILLVSVVPAAAQKVGPARGTVIVVGGGQMGPEILSRFIAAAGGPDALIVDVPTAGGDSVYPPDWRGGNALKRAGARHVVVLHTVDRRIADSDSFAAPLAKAGGVWFEGGRQWHLVDSYAGTKTERGFHEVLARGGVVGGSSAGASILASYLLRGARSGNTIIMAPGYETGFGFLQGVAIDQHVVARERLRDLADSLMPKHPELLGLSEDEGTAWVVRGDVAEIVGRNKAFVYGGSETDAGTPFLTLHPGDRYDLGARRVIHRAVDETKLSQAFVDSLMAGIGGSGGHQATVLVAREGKVLIDKSYGIPDRPNYTPTTSVPNFPLGGLSGGFNALATQLVAGDGKLTLDDTLSGGVTLRRYLADAGAVPEGGKLLAQLLGARAGMPYPRLITRRIFTPIGLHKTVTDTAGGPTGAFESNVDELYRLELGLEFPGTWVRDSLAVSFAGAPAVDPALGWTRDQFRGQTRLAEYGTRSGRRNAFVRIPGRRVAVIILTDSDDADAKAAAERILERLELP
jgi:cyanophycinase